jgi:bifunctional DNase/RNase
MIQVVIDSIRVSLMSPHRVILLREMDSERQLPIWIGPFETDAIVVELQDVETARPLTHDLLKTVIEHLGGTVSHVLVHALVEDHFTARVFIDQDGRLLEIDSRPSDAIALAVRAKVPIFVAEEVMDEAGVTQDEEILSTEDMSTSDEELDVFRDFLDTLDLDEET